MVGEVESVMCKFLAGAVLPMPRPVEVSRIFSEPAPTSNAVAEEPPTKRIPVP